MTIVNTILGRHYDLLEQAGGATGNAEPLVAKTDITYVNGLPSVVLKYEDTTGTVLLFTTNITWANGVPTEVVTYNHKSGVTKTTILTWLNGSLVEVINNLS